MTHMGALQRLSLEQHPPEVRMAPTQMRLRKPWKACPFSQA